MFIGIDDTDSRKGGCTTYIAAILCEKLKVKGFPKLIRLNPNIPFKTRGNGAISLEVETDDINEVKNTVLETVEKNARIEEKSTNPGVVFVENLRGNEKKEILSQFYHKTVSELVTIREAEEVAKQVDAKVHKFKLGRGIIGALAAIGAQLDDKTYELLAYRIPENYGKKKNIDKNSVFKMNSKTYPKTFDNVDLETKQILITPHGYDPVFSGIRGESAKIVEEAWNMIKPLEEIERLEIFETNQGTDAHLRKKKISQIKSYDCVILEGLVSKKPKTIEGGHTIFELSNGSGKVE
jgi:tRNA(Ile2)-agmatinylcytidine synthase